MGLTEKILGGKKAQARGTEFETLVRHRCKSLNVKFTHHPIGCKPFGNRRFHTIKTGYDFTLFFKQRVCLIDTKAYDSDRLSKSNTKSHQVDALFELELEGFTAGYLIYFRPVGMVYFVKASQMYYLESGHSISHEHMILIGSIEDFNITKLFDIPTSIKGIEGLVANE